MNSKVRCSLIHLGIRVLAVIPGLFISSSLPAQVSISAARQLSTGTVVEVAGIAINGSSLGTIRYIQDGTAGIAVYSSSLSQVKTGDSIKVTGTLTDYYSLLEITPVSSFQVLKSGIVVNPRLITPVQLSESFESQLVRINDVTFDAGQGSVFSPGSYTFHSGTASGEVYIRSGSPLTGTPLPLNKVSLIGVCSQFNSTYQLLPRGVEDIIGGTINFTGEVTISNITTSGFKLSWNTDKNGSTEMYYGKTPNLELGRLMSPGTGTSHTIWINGAQPAEIYYARPYSVSGADTAMAPLRAYATRSLSSGWIRTYFTRSVDPSVATGAAAVSLGAAVEDTVISYINKAKFTIDMAMYNFTLTRIPAALNQARQRGVKIRLIYNSNTSNSSLSQLSGIPTLGSPSGFDYNIMHNKFLIFDVNGLPGQAIVWTGSTNFTSQQLETDANNVVIINDQSLARAYTVEFEEMWGSAGMSPDPAKSRFGKFKTDNTPHEFIIGDKRIESYFSPSDGVNSRIISAIQSASNTVDVATMLITRDDIAEALKEKHDLGIPSHILVNSKGECTTSVVSILSGFGNRFIEDKAVTGIEHNKYVIIDRNEPLSDPLVLTGSHNWSLSANTVNDENTLIIHDQPVTNLYFQEFYSRFRANGGVLKVPENTSPDVALIVFPNPCSDKLYVLYPVNTGFKINSVTILDAFGKYILSFPAQPGETNEIDVSGLPSGMYIIVLNTSRGLTRSKFIKIG